MFCKSCGAVLSDNAKFCTKCGTPVSQVQSNDVLTARVQTITARKEPLTPVRKNNTVIIVLITVLILSLLAAAVIFVLQSGLFNHAPEESISKPESGSDVPDSNEEDSAESDPEEAKPADPVKPEKDKPVKEETVSKEDTTPEPEADAPAEEPLPEMQDAPTAPISLNMTDISITSADQTAQLQVLNGEGLSVVWSSEDSSIATVSETGLVTARSTGVCNIYADVEGSRLTCTVRASVDPLAGLNVDEEITRIREMNTECVTRIGNGEYRAVTLRRGVIAYVEEDHVVAIQVAAETDSNPYARSYYYDENGDLYFAYYIADDSRRYYFVDEHMFRWRHTPDADIRDVYTDHILETTSEFEQEEERILYDSTSLLEEVLRYTGLSR